MSIKKYFLPLITFILALVLTLCWIWTINPVPQAQAANPLIVSSQTLADLSSANMISIKDNSIRGRVETLPSYLSIEDRFTFLNQIRPAAYPLTSSPLITTETKLLAADAAAGDWFGQSIAIDGDTVVVAAHLDDDKGNNAGAAYIFKHNGTTWTQQAKLTASDAAPNDWFGFAVAISGDTVVVGALFDDDGGSSSGSAYIFQRSGATWNQQAKLTANDASAGDQFGITVAINGDSVVIGASQDSDNGFASGSAYVFQRSGAAWSQQAKLTANDAAAFDEFGLSVAISNNTVAVGAPFDDDDGSSSGSAYIFQRNGTTWSQQAKLTASDAADGDRFGYMVVIDGDTVVSGAYWDDDGGTDSGSVYIFQRNGITWSQQAKLTANDAAAFDDFGRGGAISGDTIVIGAEEDDDTGDSSGSAYIFQRSGTTWSQQLKLIASDAAAGDNFGYVVAVSGRTVAVGARFDDDRGDATGSAYVYSLLDPPDLQLTKAANPAVVTPGTFLTYTLTFSNSGGSTVSGVVVTDIVPISLTNVNVTSSGVAITDTGYTPGYVWSVQDLPPGAKGIITITGRVNPSLSNGTILINTATITSTTVDTDTLNNTASVTTPVQPTANLALSKVATPNLVFLGQPLTYTLLLTNNGPSEATNLVVTDPLPAGLGFISASPACQLVNDSLTCAAASLPPKAATTFTLVVSPTAAGIITNTASLTATQFDPDPGNNTATVQTLVEGPTITASSAIYLAIILRELNQPEVTFPVHIGDAIPIRPAQSVGEIFYTRQVQIPDTLPVGGRFYFSSQADTAAPALVDDELAVFLADGTEIFSHRVGLQPALIEVPRSVVEQMAGQTVTVQYRDVFGVTVWATDMWLIWIP